jgi:drug/metabolite transporter (DMT)-like permease
MQRALSAGLLVLLGTIWGSNFLFMKLALADISPVNVACFRTLFGAVPIVALAALRGGLSSTHAKWVLHFAAMAILANVGPYLFFVFGTAHLASGIAGVISGSIPCITAVVVAVALPEESLTIRKLAGLAVGFAGILFVAPLSNAAAQPGGSTGLGIFYMLAGSFSYALALVYAKRFVQPLGLSAVTLAAYQMTLAFLFLLPFASLGSISALAPDHAALIGVIVGLGVVGTGIAFVIYYTLIARIGALRASSVYYLPPAVALAVGAKFLGEPLAIGQLIGAALISVGIYLANSKGRSRNA